MKGLRKGLICILGFLSWTACGGKPAVEDISDIKYQVNRITSPYDDEKLYRVEDEFNFLDKYSGNAKIIKSDIAGECTSSIDSRDIKTINATVNSNKFKLGVVFSPEFLVSANTDAESYRCHLTISGTTDVGSQVDVPLVLGWNQDDFLGIDLHTSIHDIGTQRIALDLRDVVLEVLEEYKNGSTDPSIRLICSGYQDFPSILTDKSVIHRLIGDEDDNNILGLVYYLALAFGKLEEGDWFEQLDGANCVLTNNKLNTPEYRWSHVVKLHDILDKGFQLVYYLLDHKELERLELGWLRS